MSYPVFYVPAGDVLPVFFASYDGGTGASAATTGLAVTDIEIYKDGSVTQRASDAGYTLLDTDGLDFDGLTGINGFSIDTGDNTDAGFYTVGAWFTVVVSTVTVDAQTVSFIACQFRLMPAESVAGKPKVDVDAFGGSAGTFASGIPEVKVASIANNAITAASINADAITAAKIADGAIDANTFAAGAINAAAIATGAIDADALAADAGTEIATAVWASATRELTALDEDNTTIDLNATTIGAVAGAVGSVTGNVGGNVTGSVGSLAAQAKADVNAEVVDALATDTYAEPGQGAPAATATLAAKINYLYKNWRNKKTQTADTFTLFNDDGTTAGQKSTTSDDGTTATKGEMATGA